jgi:hypothetical protein
LRELKARRLLLAEHVKYHDLLLAILLGQGSRLGWRRNVLSARAELVWSCSQAVAIVSTEEKQCPSSEDKVEILLADPSDLRTGLQRTSSKPWPMISRNTVRLSLRRYAWKARPLS